VRIFTDPDTGVEAYVTPAMPPNIDRLSPEGIEAQKKIDDYSASLQRDMMNTEYARAGTLEQKQALEYLMFAAQMQISSATTAAAAVYEGGSDEEMAKAALNEELRIAEILRVTYNKMRQVTTGPEGAWQTELFPQGEEVPRPPGVPLDYEWYEDPETGEIKMAPPGTTDAADFVTVGTAGATP
jgi:hypothetical protein